jgi:Na+/H+ antiporter NhaD/arsenite permease-like protein
VLAPLTLVGASSIGNVPLVVLLLAVAPDLGAGAFYALAVLSTLAGNLLVVGSLANIIAVERARDAGVVLTFVEHARCGIPMTLLSFLLALAWLVFMGYIGV